MTKNNTKPKKSVAIRVFNILFIVGLVIAIAVGIMMFTPVASTLKSTLQSKTWAVSMVGKMNTWVDKHIIDVFNLPSSFRGHGLTFTSCFYLYLLCASLYCALFLIYLPFPVMHKAKVKGKTESWRKALCWICFVIVTLIVLAAYSLLFSAKLTSTLGSKYTWFVDLCHKWSSLFYKGNALNVLVVERISTNHTAWAALWFGFFVLVVEVLVLIISSLGKVKQESKAEKPIKNEPNEIEEGIAEIENTTPAPTPASAATKVEEKIQPTIRVIALLNALNPLYETKIENLPDIEDFMSEDELEKELTPSTVIINHEAIENKENVDVANEIATSISPFEKHVDVLPGIDEWDADPWLEEDEKSLSPLEDNTTDILEILEPSKKEEADIEDIVAEEMAKPVDTIDNSDTVENDLTPTLAPEQENIPVEEVEQKQEEVIEEPIKEEKVEDIVEEVKEEVVEEVTKPITEEVAEETIKEEKIEEVTEPITTEVVEEKTEENTKVVAINDIVHDGLRPQEEENHIEEQNDGQDRSEFKKVVANNDHVEVITNKVDDKDTWDCGTYVPEIKKVEDIPAPKPIPVNPHIAPIGLKQFDPSKKAGNRPTGPIGVVQPVKKEEPVKQEEPVEEKKVIAPISGPLHSTEKSKHEKIEKVEARHVAFALKNYEVKTYEGDLTAAEAFSMGVTKVQPTVNPIFANQKQESGWKEKRRQESIRQNGYGEVTTVEKLNGKPTTTSSTAKKSFSIRDLAKAKRNTTTEVKQEENTDKKISKPITPVAFKPVVDQPKTEEKKEENPFEANNPAPNFRPIAPIQHKEKKRPEIKPIDPMKSKK